jgi:uncharacterized protein (UPF0371 family)
MTSAVGFDNDSYLDQQSRAIVERFDRIGGKLYLEFGGKIAFDFHASRVLPGYDPNVKIRLLQTLREQAEIVICIYAGAIERKKMRADFGVPYDVDAMKLIDDLREWGLLVRAVVVTRFDGQPSARVFQAPTPTMPAYDSATAGASTFTGKTTSGRFCANCAWA